MASITFQWDKGQLEAWKGHGVEKAVASAMSKAGRGAIRAMQAASTRSVRQRKRLKVARVKKGLKLTFPQGKELADLVWRMDVSGAPIPLGEFPHSQTRKGVTVAVNNGARKLIRSAFVATLKSGHEGVFMRRGKGRLPIDEKFSTRISDVFKDEGMIPAVFKVTEAVLVRDFHRLLPLELAKLKK